MVKNVGKDIVSITPVKVLSFGSVFEVVFVVEVGSDQTVDFGNFHHSYTEVAVDL